MNEDHTLIVVNNIDKWATHLSRKQVADCRGDKGAGHQLIRRQLPRQKPLVIRGPAAGRRLQLGVPVLYHL